MQSKLKYNPHKPEGLVKATDVSVPLVEILIHYVKSGAKNW